MPGPPPKAQRAIAPILKTLNERFAHLDDEAGRLKDRWVEIVGESLARLCEPERIIVQNGRANMAATATLEIRSETVYAPLLQHQSDMILGRVNLYLGGNRLKKLRILQGRLNGGHANEAFGRIQPTPIQTKRPLSASDEWRLQQSLETVADLTLRATLLKLGRGVLSQGEARKAQNS